MSLNHNVCSREERRRDCEPERFGSFQIHDQFIFCRSLHRKVGWPLTLKDPIDIAGRAPELVGEIRPIRDQALVQKDDSFQLGPALLPALVKRVHATTCGARGRLRRPRSGSRPMSRKFHDAHLILNQKERL